MNTFDVFLLRFTDADYIFDSCKSVCVHALTSFSSVKYTLCTFFRAVCVNPFRCRGLHHVLHEMSINVLFTEG